MRDLARDLRECDWADIEKALEDLPDGYEVVVVDTTKLADCPECDQPVEVIVETEDIEPRDRSVSRAVLLPIIEQIESILAGARARKGLAA